MAHFISLFLTISGLCCLLILELLLLQLLNDFCLLILIVEYLPYHLYIFIDYNFNFLDAYLNDYNLYSIFYNMRVGSNNDVSHEETINTAPGFNRNSYGSKNGYANQPPSLIEE